MLGHKEERKDPNAKSYTDVKEMFREILADEA